MPTAPASLCAGGCGRAVLTRFCEKCARDRNQNDQQRRGTANERGYNWKWRKARDGWLKVHPLCVECLKQSPQIITPATEVDHIIPHRGDMKLFWDPNNWQSLCKSHHSAKTWKENNPGYSP